MATKSSRRVPLFLVAGALAAVVAAGWLGLSLFLDADHLKDQLQRAVHRATGRDLAIGGPVHLQFGFSPSLVAENVSITNIAGGSRPLMVTAHSLSARLALFPLLAGDAVIDALTITGADVLFERGPDGTPNWQFTPPRRALFQSGGAPSGASGGSGRVAIRAIIIQGGQITWQPPAPAAPVVIGIDRLEAGTDPSIGSTLLTVQATHGASKFSVSITGGSLERLQGGPMPALAGAWPVEMDASTQGATLHVEGGVAHPDQLKGYALRVKAAADDLGTIGSIFPALNLPRLRDVALSAMVADDSNGAPITSQLSLHAGASDLNDFAAGLAIKSALLAAPGPGQLAQLSVDGTYQGTPMRVAGTAMQPDQLAPNAPMQVSFSGEAANASFSAHGSAPRAWGLPGLDMAISARAPDLSQLAPLFGHALPAARDFSFDAHAGDVGGPLRGVVLRDLAISSSLGDLNGDTTLVWSPRPALSGTLQSTHFDLDALLPSVGGTDGVPAAWPPPNADSAIALPTPATQPIAPIAHPMPGFKLPLTAMRAIDADLSLTMADVGAGGQHYRDVAAHLVLNGGKFSLNPFRAAAPEGEIVGGASMDASSDMPPVAITLRSPDIAAAALVAALGYPGAATGSLQLDAQLNSTGQSLAELEAALSGHLGLAMVGGQVDEGFVQGLIGDTLAQAGVPNVASGPTALSCLAVRLDFTEGRGTVRALAFDTPRLSLDVRGGFNMADRTLDLHLRPHLHLGETDAAAPVALTGSFDHPQAALDPVLGGRVGIVIGGAGGGAVGSSCPSKLTMARGGLLGTMPAPAPPSSTAAFSAVKKPPTDLLRGLFH